MIHFYFNIRGDSLVCSWTRSRTKLKLLIRIIYVCTASVHTRIFFTIIAVVVENRISNFQELFIVIIGTRSNDSYMAHKVIAFLTQSRHILFSDAESMLASIDAAASNPISLPSSDAFPTPTFFTFFFIIQSSFPMCQIFLTSNEPPRHLGPKYFTHKNFTTNVVSPNATSLRARYSKAFHQLIWIWDFESGFFFFHFVVGLYACVCVSSIKFDSFFEHTVQIIDFQLEQRHYTQYRVYWDK